MRRPHRLGLRWAALAEVDRGLEQDDVVREAAYTHRADGAAEPAAG